jgi:hypothetical protein
LGESGVNAWLRAAILAALTVAFAAAAPNPGGAREPYWACVRWGKCYRPDFLGGMGLTPRRHYVIAYGADAVCKTIRDAVNKAIAAGPASLRAVQRPLPPEAQTDTWHWYGQRITHYETRNPIFAADIFLPWNWMNWEPWPGATPGNPDDLKDDYDRARWMIAPVFNDGKPVLMTQKPRSGVSVWDVPAEELNKHDWSDWRSYKDFGLLQSHCDNPRDDRVGPLSALADRCALGPHFAVGPAYPKLSQAEQDVDPFAHADRWLSIFYFAQVNGHYYAVLQPPRFDLLIVADPGTGMPSPEKFGLYSESSDVCYLKPVLGP